MFRGDAKRSWFARAFTGQYDRKKGLNSDSGICLIRRKSAITLTLSKQELIPDYRVEPPLHRGLKGSLAKPSVSFLFLPSHKKADRGGGANTARRGAALYVVDELRF